VTLPAQYHYYISSLGDMTSLAEEISYSGIANICIARFKSNLNQSKSEILQLTERCSITL